MTVPYLSSDDHDADDRAAFWGGVILVGTVVFWALVGLGVIRL